MGLAIAVFVPEGIVVASDGLAETRNAENDHGFLHKMQKRIFVYEDKFIICIHETSYINGLPCAIYVEKVFKSIKKTPFLTVNSFTETFGKELKSYTDKYRLSFYAIGMQKSDNNEDIPNIVLYDDGRIIAVNRGNDNNIVYNYHSVGHNMWLNKLLLPTSCEIDKDHRIDFESVAIDFSKYSIEDALLFSQTLIRLSWEMDSFAQLKQMIGEHIVFGILTLNGKISINSLCLSNNKKL